MENLPRKVKVMCHTAWSHHNSGWPYIASGLYRHLNKDNGVHMYTNSVIAEIFVKNKPIETDWIGFLHATPDNDLRQIINSKTCQESLKRCKGLFALSNYVCEFIKEEMKVDTARILMSVANVKTLFNPEKFLNSKPKLILIGHWLRKFESIYKIETDTYTKSILKCTNTHHPDGVDIINYLPAEQYEKLFENNVVFLDLLDASANNIIVECILHRTPVLVNRLPAIEEYLGKDYPLFFNNIEEASEKLSCQELILKAHQHLLKIDTEQFSLQNFINSVAKSKIYENLNHFNILI